MICGSELLWNICLCGWYFEISPEVQTMAVENINVENESETSQKFLLLQITNIPLTVGGLVVWLFVRLFVFLDGRLLGSVDTILYKENSSALL